MIKSSKTSLSSGLIKDLSIHDQKNQSIYQVQNQIYTKLDGNKFTYYDNNEIINGGMYDLFGELENTIFHNMPFKNIKCKIGEKKIFIKTNDNNHPLISVCHLDNNIVITISHLFPDDFFDSSAIIIN